MLFHTREFIKRPSKPVSGSMKKSYLISKRWNMPSLPKSFPLCKGLMHFSHTFNHHHRFFSAYVQLRTSCLQASLSKLLLIFQNPGPLVISSSHCSGTQTSLWYGAIELWIECFTPYCFTETKDDDFYITIKFNSQRTDLIHQYMAAIFGVGAPIWPSWCHVKTLYISSMGIPVRVFC